MGFREALEDKKDLIIFFTYQFPLVKTHTENPTKIPPYLMTLQSLQIPLIVDLKKRKLIDKVTAKTSFNFAIVILSDLFSWPIFGITLSDFNDRRVILWDYLLHLFLVY